MSFAISGPRKLLRSSPAIRLRLSIRSGGRVVPIVFCYVNRRMEHLLVGRIYFLLGGAISICGTVSL